MNKILEKESLIIEFKEDAPLSDDSIVDVVVGFANAQGGSLYLGVDDKGTVTGLHPSRKNVEGIGAMIAHKTVPPVSVHTEILDQNEHQCLKIGVPKSQVIVAASNGKVLRRKNKCDNTPETAPFYPCEFISRLTELTGPGKLDYSAQAVPNATYNDLDPIERERLRKLIGRGDAKLLELTDEDLDKSLQFVKSEGDKLIPTVTGLLLIGKSESLKKYLPTARITFQVKEGTDPRIDKDITMPLLAALEIIEEYIKAWNPEREIESGLFRIQITEFDNDAIREALVNALSHRDYTRLEPVYILIDDSGFTISSPGGFIEGVTLANLLTVEPQGRNPTLADALKRLGLAERTGRGIDRIYEGSLIYGRPWPDYSKSSTTMVRLFIQKAMPDAAFTRMILEEKNRLGRNLPINPLLILSFLKDKRHATIHQIAEKIHLSEPITKSALEELSKAGLIEAQEEGRERIYMLSSKVYQKTYGGNGIKVIMTEYIPETPYQITGLLKNCEEVEFSSRYKFIGKTKDPASAKDATQWLEMASNSVLNPDTVLLIIPHDGDEGCEIQVSKIQSCTITPEGKYDVKSQRVRELGLDLQKITITAYRDPLHMFENSLVSELLCGRRRGGREIPAINAWIYPPKIVKHTKD